MILIISNVLYLIYLLYYRPLEEGLNIEINNEIFTLIMSELMLVFTDFIDNIETKDQVS